MAQSNINIINVKILVCGVRPATIRYCEYTDLYYLESSAFDSDTTIYPSSVCMPFTSLRDALDFANYLVSPILGGTPWHGRKVSIISLHIEFDAVVPCYIHCYRYDVYTVYVPSLDYSDTFSSLESALKFCVYIQSPIKIDTEATTEIC